MGSKRRTHLNPTQVVAFYDSALVTLHFAVVAFSQQQGTKEGFVYCFRITVCAQCVWMWWSTHMWHMCGCQITTLQGCSLSFPPVYRFWR